MTKGTRVALELPAVNTVNPAVTRVLDKARADEAVLAVLLFGSHARGDAHPTSDIDLCLVHVPGRESKAGRTLLRMRYLEETSGRCRVHVFQDLPLYIRRPVLKEGVVLLCKDWDALYALAYRTAQAFADFKPAYRAYLEQVERAGS